MAASATSSILLLEAVLSIISVFERPAALAVATSASGWAMPWLPAGQTNTGMLMSVPSMVVAILRSSTLRMKRGRIVSWSNALRFRLVVNSSMAPASIKSQLSWGKASLALAS